eukprot:1148800-Pelagomonas_calceolata.AAC.4
MGAQEYLQATAGAHGAVDVCVPVAQEAHHVRMPCSEEQQDISSQPPIRQQSKSIRSISTSKICHSNQPSATAQLHGLRWGEASHQ